MERWLSKSRVLIALCALMLMAALNRQDPMAYGVFLFLVVICVLGYGLPWLSLRGMQLRWLAQEAPQVMEGKTYSLHLVLERSVRWPALLVEIEAEWTWASQRLVRRHTVALVRKGQPMVLEHACSFPCRGLYRLESVRLTSGFPLGLLRACLHMHCPQLAVHVLPAPQSFAWPLPWVISVDPQGERSTRHLGHSMDLGMLRLYQDGEPLGRVNWRASARTGQLVIQHYQQSGSLRLHVLVAVPGAAECGQPGSAGEQAMRMAAGLVQVAQTHQVQLRLHVPHQVQVLTDPQAALLALASAQPVEESLHLVVHQALPLLHQGDQVALVLPSNLAVPEVLAAVCAFRSRGLHLLACLAPAHGDTDKSLQQSLEQAGYRTHTEGI
ncbi:MAG TPA: DUF58 domain-containing protein [Comamonas sp.]